MQDITNSISCSSKDTVSNSFYMCIITYSRSNCEFLNMLSVYSYLHCTFQLNGKFVKQNKNEQK